MKIFTFIILASFLLLNCLTIREKEKNKEELCTSLKIKFDENIPGLIKNVVFYEDEKIVFGKYFYENEKIFTICNRDNITGIHINFGKRNGFFNKPYHFITQNQFENSRPKKFVNFFDLNYEKKIVNANVFECENIKNYDFLDYVGYIYSPIFYPLGIFPFEYKRLCIIID